MRDPEFQHHRGAARNGTPSKDLSHAAQEIRLLEYLDGKLGTAEAKELEAHLQSCPQCQELRRGWQELDSKLRHSEPAKLSPDFQANFWRRIEKDTANQPALRLQLDLAANRPADFFAADLRFFGSQIFRLFDSVGVALAAMLGCYVVYKLVAKLPAASVSAFVNKLQAWTWLICTIAGLLVAAAGILLASKTRVRRRFAAW
jgi:anti-sigma factor RsiW